MAKSNRKPIQSDPQYHEKLRNLQAEIMGKQKKKMSFTEMQSEMIKFPEWKLIEKRLLGEVSQIDFKIRLDKRFFE